MLRKWNLGHTNLSEQPLFFIKQQYYGHTNLSEQPLKIIIFYLNPVLSFYFHYFIIFSHFNIILIIFNKFITNINFTDFIIPYGPYGPDLTGQYLQALNLQK